MTDAICVDFNIGAGLIAGRPVANSQSPGHNHPFALIERLGEVQGKLPESGDGVPIGVAVNPAICSSVKSTLRRREPKARNRQPLSGCDASRKGGYHPGQS